MSVHVRRVESKPPPIECVVLDTKKRSSTDSCVRLRASRSGVVELGIGSPTSSETITPGYRGFFNPNELLVFCRRVAEMLGEQGVF